MLVLHNWILGILATTIWTTNFLVYFAPEIRAWRRASQAPAPVWPYETSHGAGFTGPLPPDERQRFPPPAPPVHEAEVIPFPGRRRPAAGSWPPYTNRRRD